MHVGQAVVAAAMAEREPLVIQAEQVEDGRMEVVNVNFIFHHGRSDVVGAAVTGAALHARAGEP